MGITVSLFVCLNSQTLVSLRHKCTQCVLHGLPVPITLPVADSCAPGATTNKSVCKSLFDC